MNTFVLFKNVMTLRPSKTLSNVKDIFHSKVNNILKSEKKSGKVKDKWLLSAKVLTNCFSCKTFGTLAKCHVEVNSFSLNFFYNLNNSSE